MILKIANYRLENKVELLDKKTGYRRTLDTFSWWFYDGIVRVKTTVYLNHYLALAEYPEPDVMFTDVRNFRNCGCNGEIDSTHTIVGCPDCTKTAVVSCRLEDDSELTVMVDTRAYLLNENGKTIETVICNYVD